MFEVLNSGTRTKIENNNTYNDSLYYSGAVYSGSDIFCQPGTHVKGTNLKAVFSDDNSGTIAWPKKIHASSGFVSFKVEKSDSCS